MESLTPLIEKYISKESVYNAIQEHNYNQEFAQEFIRLLDESLVGIDDEIKEYELADELLEYPIAYMKYYIESINNNYSKAWSKEYALRSTVHDTEDLIWDCYNASKKENKEQALNDLKNYCILTNRDQIFTKFFIKRTLNGDALGEDPIEKTIENFVFEYNKQLAKGKSELYAETYADLLEDYHPIYCEDYAFMYEESLKKGKSDDYARVYADKYADELVDVKRRSGISEDEEALEFAKDKAKAYINGWEYAKENKLKNSDVFIACYEHAYLNTLYTDNLSEWSSIEECESIALNKALESYGKRVKG